MLHAPVKDKPGHSNGMQGWLYLEPIFGSEDILQQMPNEGRKFRAVDVTWRRVMAAVRKAPEVLVMCSDDELLKNLTEANKFLEQVHSCYDPQSTCSLYILQGYPRVWR